MGIKVTDLEGRRVSFLRAAGRTLGKIVSAIILYIGFLMAAFTSNKQALHDIMANCFVLNNEPAPEQTPPVPAQLDNSKDLW